MSMTREQALVKARARRAELALERADERVELRREFKAWVPRERELFETMLGIREEFGIHSGEHHEAQQEWRRAWRNMPQPTAAAA